MKFELTSISRTICTIGAKVKKAAPTIAVITGTACGIGATVTAVKETLTVGAIMTEYKETAKTIDDVEERINNGEEIYFTNKKTNKTELETVEYLNRDRKVLKIQTVAKLAKHYKFTIALSALSVVLVLSGYGEMKKRFVGAVAAYEGLYRTYIKTKKEAEKNSKKTEMPDINDKNEEQKDTSSEVKSRVDDSDFCRIFDKSSSMYRENREMNLGYLKSVEKYCTNLLHIRGHLFLNEVYDALGMSHTETGALCGWLYNSNDGDNFVSFNIDEALCEYNYADDIYPVDPEIFMYFNCVGPIYNRI